MEDIKSFILYKIGKADQVEGIPLYHLINRVKEKENSNSEELIKEVFKVIYELESLGLIEIKIVTEDEGEESYAKITEIGKVRLEQG